MTDPIRPKATGALSPNVDGLACRLWALADGQRSIAELALATGSNREAVFAALDDLADLELLERRVTPPAGSGRFSRGHAIAGAAALVAGSSFALAAKPAGADVSPTPGPSEEAAKAADAPAEAAFKKSADTAEATAKSRSVDGLKSAEGDKKVAASALVDLDHKKASEQKQKSVARLAQEDQAKKGAITKSDQLNKEMNQKNALFHDMELRVEQEEQAKYSSHERSAEEGAKKPT